MKMKNSRETLCETIITLIKSGDPHFMKSEGDALEREEVTLDAFFISAYGRYCKNTLSSFLANEALDDGVIAGCIETINNICDLHKHNGCSFIGDYFASYLEFGLLSHPMTETVTQIKNILSRKSFEVIKIYSLNVYGY